MAVQPKVHVTSLFTFTELEQAIEKGYVIRRKHPDYPLFIHNYTKTAVFANAWNNVTLACRGLILDSEGFIVARPFRKFFGYTEKPLPAHALGSPPLIFDKADGVLGIIYETPLGFAVATRGRFDSPQAKIASKMLGGVKYRDLRIPQGITPLVEIIAPEYKVVVDYGGTKDLVLLAAIDNATGADVPIWTIDWWPGTKVRQHNVKNPTVDEGYRYGTSDAKKDEEGVVMVWYRPGQESIRLKVKHPDYIYRHRMVFNLTAKTVWSALKEGSSIDDILIDAPEEVWDWVTAKATALLASFRELEEAVYNNYHDLIEKIETEYGFTEEEIRQNRKIFADYAKTMKNSGFLFMLLNGDSINEKLWDTLRPEHESYAQNFTS